MPTGLSHSCCARSFTTDERFRVQAQIIRRGVGSTRAITNQIANKWQYFIFTVPATNALGWDLRMTNVTSGDPRMVIRRDILPS